MVIGSLPGCWTIHRDGDPVASFVEHIHDEFIHHAAEIAVLRDLSRCRVA
jgi:hypothetical protein